MREIDIRSKCRVNSNREMDTFVGLRCDDGDISINFPMGYHISEDNKELRKDIILLFTTLTANTERRESELLAEGSSFDEVEFPLQSYIYLIKDFFARGYYREQAVSYKIAKTGKVNWNRTIKTQRPYVQDTDVFYLDFVTKKNSIKENELITLIHEYCVYESFERIGWLFTKMMPKKPRIAKRERVFRSVLKEKIANTFNDSLDGSVKLNGQFLFISNFRKNEEDTVKTLKVRYSSREFIENQILQLCQFNDEGKCILDVNKKQYNTSGVEPEYYETLYEELVSYYEALLTLNKKENVALERILNNSQSSRVLRLNDYVHNQEQNGVVEYKIRRICRLRHPYMLYLYKMYLEHQGRHPFDCMNMSRVQEMQVKLKQNDSTFVSVDMVLTPDRDMNRSHIENMDWYIDISNLENAVSNLLGLSVKIQENTQYIEIKEEGTKFECMLDSGEKKKMCVLKIGDMVSIEQCE